MARQRLVQFKKIEKEKTMNEMKLNHNDDVNIIV
jgi:hypothetical protein